MSTLYPTPYSALFVGIRQPRHTSPGVCNLTRGATKLLLLYSLFLFSLRENPTWVYLTMCVISLFPSLRRKELLEMHERHEFCIYFLCGYGFGAHSTIATWCKYSAPEKIDIIDVIARWEPVRTQFYWFWCRLALHSYAYTATQHRVGSSMTTMKLMSTMVIFLLIYSGQRIAHKTKV